MATRSTMFQELGYIQIAEVAAERAFKVFGEQEWRTDADRSPHGRPWHVSFHASQFPADEQACPRKALYTMLDIPDAKPTDRAGRTVMAMGKAIEDEYVWAFHHAGMLLSEPPDAEHQTAFRVPDAWLTASTDAVILPEGWTKGHVVEIKSKDHDVITAMRSGAKGPDPAHVTQCKVYIGLAHLFSPFYWPSLEPVDTGSLLYVSRNRPHYAHEFVFKLDQEMLDAGLERLKLWRDMFIAGQLPERPADWQWSKGACQFCEMKNVTLADGTKLGCKQDVKENIQLLADSTLVTFAKSLHPDYDVLTAIHEVFDFWGYK